MLNSTLTQHIKITFLSQQTTGRSITNKVQTYNLILAKSCTLDCQFKLLIILATEVQGNMHISIIRSFLNLILPKPSISTVMDILHRTSIQYLTHLIINIRKLENHQTHGPPPHLHTINPPCLRLSWCLIPQEHPPPLNIRNLNPTNPIQ